MPTHKQLPDRAVRASPGHRAKILRRPKWRTTLLTLLYGFATLAGVGLLNTLVDGLQALGRQFQDGDASPNSATADASGRVVAVSDGDTFIVETTEKVRLVVRVAEIDAPEQGQPFGSQSKKALSKLVQGRWVVLQVQTTDKYGRAVARPYVGEIDVSAQMVSTGTAWVYRRYLRDDRLLELEEAAKTEERGLWGLPESQRMPPWDWRRTHRRRN